jgi:hypothetical protein
MSKKRNDTDRKKQLKARNGSVRPERKQPSAKDTYIKLVKRLQSVVASQLLRVGTVTVQKSNEGFMTSLGGDNSNRPILMLLKPGSSNEEQATLDQSMEEGQVEPSANDSVQRDEMVNTLFVPGKGVFEETIRALRQIFEGIDDKSFQVVDKEEVVEVECFYTRDEKAFSTMFELVQFISAKVQVKL